MQYNARQCDTTHDNIRQNMPIQYKQYKTIQDTTIQDNTIQYMTKQYNTT